MSSVQTVSKLCTFHLFKGDSEVIGLSQFCFCLTNFVPQFGFARLLLIPIPRTLKFIDLQGQRSCVKLLIHDIMSDYLKYFGTATAKYLMAKFHLVSNSEESLCFPDVCLWPLDIFSSSFSRCVLSLNIF